MRAQKKAKKELPLNFVIIEAKAVACSLDNIFVEIDRLRKYRKSSGLAYKPVLMVDSEEALWEGARGLLQVFYSKGLGKTVVSSILLESTSLHEKTIRRLVGGDPYDPKEV